MKMDETLYGIAEKIKNFAQIYLVDITEVRFVGFIQCWWRAEYVENLRQIPPCLI